MSAVIDIAVCILAVLANMPIGYLAWNRLPSEYPNRMCPFWKLICLIIDNFIVNEK